MRNDLPSADRPAIPDEAIRLELRRSQVVDLTTFGRRTGEPRRIEIVFHAIEGRIFISGIPSHRTRAWIHNLRADPRLVLHLKAAVRADLPGRGRIVDDEAERRRWLDVIARNWRRTEVDTMVASSPLIEVVLDDPWGPVEPGGTAV
jgi:deazaflavin-dependent oxidoreductase (nitroreductase family)